MKRGVALALCGSLLLLAGCGLRGDLQRAPPLFGPDKQRYRAEQERQRAEAEAKAQAEAARKAEQAAAAAADPIPPR